MKITFRTDASLQIGTGHVMRCLTLARALREAGAVCKFITRAHPGNMSNRIQADGFEVSLLPAPEGPQPLGPPAHAHWAGVDWAQDAAETRATLGDAPDWLIMDHYAFDARWQRAVLPEGTRLMVIDDLADRPHACDLLLDQNLGRNAADYSGLVPDHCKLLIGPQYALLRPEFAAMRAQSLAERSGRGLRHILISMGGVDAQDATSQILDALSGTDLPDDLRVSVIMGAQAPALEKVRGKARELPWPTEVLVDVSDMASRMAAADLAIGAGGSTTWERCCLGLPSMIVQIADNQAGIAHTLEKAGAALNPGPLAASDFINRFGKALVEARANLDELANSASTICDGDGVGRVLASIVPAVNLFRDANLGDSRRVWEWRAASGLQRFGLSGQAPEFSEHHHWFTTALNNSKRSFRILVQCGYPCGYLRFDFEKQCRARVSICLAPDMRKKGLAELLLAEANRFGTEVGVRHLDAEIHPENGASIRCFELAGYRRGKDIGPFRSYQKTLGEVK